MRALEFCYSKSSSNFRIKREHRYPVLDGVILGTAVTERCLCVGSLDVLRFVVLRFDTLLNYHHLKSKINMLDIINKYSNWIIGVVLVGILLVYLKPTNKRSIEPSTDAQFQSTVAEESRPVLVKFGATWCPPCRSTDAALAEYESTSNGEVKVVIMDVDANPSLSRHYGVRSIPHSFLFLHGKVIDDRVGGMDAQEIGSWIRSNEATWKNEKAAN